jgi:hypothetical protein
MTPFGNMHVQISVDPKSDRELEVFSQLGKGGDLANSDLEAICRMVSLWLRSGGALTHVVQQLKGIGSSLQVSTKEGKIMSLGDGLARALTKYMRVKTHFGLQNLLLGMYDLAELERVERGEAPTVPVVHAVVNANGHNHDHGNGNGHSKPTNGNGHGNGHSTAAKPAAKTATATAEGVFSETERFGKPNQQEAFKVVCPSCQSPLRYSEGCCACSSCGYSHC